MQPIHFMVRSKCFTAMEQISALKSIYRFEKSDWRIRHNGFTWIFNVRPTELSDEYILKVDYNETHFPKVYVLSPKPLPLANGASKLPHTYDTRKQRLCLFHPRNGEWNSSMLIANTIIHWAIEWLYYYENWVYTGKWFGGGHGDWDACVKDDSNMHAD